MVWYFIKDFLKASYKILGGAYNIIIIYTIPYNDYIYTIKVIKGLLTVIQGYWPGSKNYGYQLSDPF